MYLKKKRLSGSGKSLDDKVIVTETPREVLPGQPNCTCGLIGVYVGCIKVWSLYRYTKMEQDDAIGLLLQQPEGLENPKLSMQ